MLLGSQARGSLHLHEQKKTLALASRQRFFCRKVRFSSTQMQQNVEVSQERQAVAKTHFEPFHSGRFFTLFLAMVTSLPGMAVVFIVKKSRPIGILILHFLRDSNSPERCLHHEGSSEECTIR
jgi:hypothetical protein